MLKKLLDTAQDVDSIELDQQKAIADLEAAFAQAGKAGLVVFDGLGILFCAERGNLEENQAIDTHGVYIGVK